MTGSDRACVTLKLATSLDGRIATATGESRWITGPSSREAVHRLRSQYDAVLIGIETALADDPELTVRLPAYVGAQPARVVLDSRQRLPLTGKLARTARQTRVVVVSTEPPLAELTACGVEIVQAPTVGEARPDLPGVLEQLAMLGLRRIFVEGGGQVAASFLRCGLVQKLEWFRAPMVLGGEGRPGVGSLALGALASAPRFRRTEVQTLGDDLWERYERVG
jgi:diaminohydroxyphosphoribosylaminopyrimidine deaminase/5-amino-6-(5-phosphoribosylamino)uracil reductase